MTSVSRPDLHHDCKDQRLLAEPMAKNTIAVMMTASSRALSNESRNGNKGTAPQIIKAANVLRPDRVGTRKTGLRPYSSVSMVLTQVSSFEVIAATASSSACPVSPLACRICLISSRSPSGAKAMCFLSISHRRA